MRARLRVETTTIKLLLTMEETAQALSLGLNAVYELVYRKEIDSIKIGRSRRIPLASIEAFIQRQMAEQQ